MNRKLISVFFCALVCSTLAHEHLKAHELQRHHARSQKNGIHNARSGNHHARSQSSDVHHARSQSSENHHARPQSSEVLHARSQSSVVHYTRANQHHARSQPLHHSRANQKQCNYVCPVPNPSPEAEHSPPPLGFLFIKDTNVFALVNPHLDVAIIFQIGEPIALLVNGKVGVVTHVDKETVVYYPSSTEGLWKQPDSSLEDYVKEFGPLTNVNKWKNGQSFKASSVSKEVQTIILSIIDTIDIELGFRAKLNPYALISLVSVDINSLFNSKEALRLLLPQLSSSFTLMVGGLGKIVNLFEGLTAIGKQLNGGIQALIGKDISTSLLLGENSGLSSLIDLLIQTGGHADVSKILGDLLKSPEAIMGLAVQLDGGIYVGISGITAVIYSIQLYAAKKITLEALIDVLIQVEAMNGHVKITKEVWNNLINRYFVLAQSQVSQFKSDSSWSELNKFFQDIKDEKFVINGINVSSIINFMIASTYETPTLSTVLKILVQLKPVVSLNKLIATLYSRLIYFIVSGGQGLIFVKTLLAPDLTISINLSLSQSIIRQIMSKANVIDILNYLAKSDIISAIFHSPVLGPILNNLQSTIRSLGLANQVTVSGALNSEASLLDNFKNFILFGVARGGKAPSTQRIAGLSIIGGGASVNVNTKYIPLVSSVSGSSSISQETTAASSSSSSGSSGASSNSEGSSSETTTSPSSSSSESSESSSSSENSSSGSTPSSSSSSSGTSQDSSSSEGSSSETTAIPSSSSNGNTGSSSSRGSSSETTVSTSSSVGGSVGGSGSHSGGISIGGSASLGSDAGSSLGGSGSHSGGISLGGHATGGGSQGGSASHSGGISIGGSSDGAAKAAWSLF